MVFFLDCKNTKKIVIIGFSQLKYVSLQTNNMSFPPGQEIKVGSFTAVRQGKDRTTKSE